MATTQIDTKRLKRATGNLNKVAILLALVGLTLLYLGWIRYPVESEDLMREMVWCLRIVTVVILYISLKCFLIARYLGTNEVEGD
jgi:hypothetical protein